MSAIAGKLKFAVLGTGRMVCTTSPPRTSQCSTPANQQGARHAQNVAYRTPRAELLSICDPRADVLESMRSKLPPAVQQFKSADECLDQKGIQAVLIASETSLHAELAKKAMDRGLVNAFSIL
jgi:myo-inositol 2-dehydrogenase/D-chiro-inositol 1-dehydrogenase